MNRQIWQRGLLKNPRLLSDMPGIMACRLPGILLNGFGPGERDRRGELTPSRVPA
ncbi:MAG: hypothetical protein OXF88_05800 [Rhodobacteraceae bacterium]|nr:hypothetical protein [Paracoccaceae bacterium]MCY4141906.1 hypothetical protein [Paracoccaceae bacterium]